MVYVHIIDIIINVLKSAKK